ncbi:MAG: hypothetical protein K2Y37_02125 [Pirellulales bacterium]|nr:hypothetical protein [Pirellulales bacterium]
MTYPFPPDVQQLVREQMALGSFSSEDELLRAALHALEEQRQAIVYDDPETLAGIRRGLEEMKAGLGRPFEEFDAEFHAK